MAQSDNYVSRSLTPDDLDAVINIDRQIAGRSRNGFFANRLMAAIEIPDDFVVVGIEKEAELIGFAIARIHEGEFGTEVKIAVLDAIGVDPKEQSSGVGHQLLDAIDDRLQKKNVTEIRTQADWRFSGLLKFFKSTGFEVAPAHILERPATARF